MSKPKLISWKLLLLSLVTFLNFTGAHGAEVSITIDDFDIHENTMFSARDRNEKILATLTFWISRAWRLIMRHIPLLIVNEPSSTALQLTVLR